VTPTENWLARLIAHPTISADTNQPLIEEIETALVKAGAVCERFPDETGQKIALLARLGPDVDGGLMLSGHVDVVPVVGQQWTVPPFTMTRRDGLLYGRGSADMKGFIASIMAMVETLDIAKLDKPLWLAISYDEEIGCVGVRPMLDVIAARGIRPDLIVVGEPTSMQIGLGHKGKMALHVTTKGEPRHSSEAPLALNALHLASDFISALRSLQDELASAGQQDKAYSVPYATLHVGVLKGGTAVNLVPDKAEMLMECRMLATDDSEELENRIRDLAMSVVQPYQLSFPYAAIEVDKTVHYPGLTSDPHHPILLAFADCLPKETARCHVSYGTEGGLFAQALDVPVVICGPGNMDQGHRPDEFIAASQLAACDKLLLSVIDRFCCSVKTDASKIPKQEDGKL